LEGHDLSRAATYAVKIGLQPLKVHVLASQIIREAGSSKSILKLTAD
jgi:hypothetical protein